MSRAATTHGVWLIAQTWAHGWYPCRCRRDRECWTSVSQPDGHPAYWCPCWGRLDLEKLPSYCCAPGHPFHAQRTQPTPALVSTDTQPVSDEGHNGHTRQPTDREVAGGQRPAPHRQAVSVPLPDERTVSHLLASGVPVPV